MHGIKRKYGWFDSCDLSIHQMSEEIDETLPYYSTVQTFLNEENIVANKITYKNTEYNCSGHSVVLIHETERKSDFSFGVLKKFFIKKNVNNEPEITILYQCTKSEYLENFGFYKTEPIEQFGMINIDCLASFCPLNLYTTNIRGQLKIPKQFIEFIILDKA